MSAIHKSATIHSDVVLGNNVTIGPFSVIGQGCSIGDNNYIGPHCILENVQLGTDNQLLGAVYLGFPPQDILRRTPKFDLHIGNRNIFHEGCSIHRGLESPTVIGSDCIFMVNSHVGHDCEVRDHVVLVNGASLGGYVEIEERAIISDSVAVHQYSKIGTLSIVSGVSGVNKDIIPYCVAGGRGRIARLVGPNLVGLKRSGFSSDVIREIKNAIRKLMKFDKTLNTILDSILAENSSPEIHHLVEFCRNSKRGIARVDRFR